MRVHLPVHLVMIGRRIPLTVLHLFSAVVLAWGTASLAGDRSGGHLGHLVHVIALLL